MARQGACAWHRAPTATDWWSLHVGEQERDRPRWPTHHHSVPRQDSTRRERVGPGPGDRRWVWPAKGDTSSCPAEPRAPNGVSRLNESPGTHGYPLDHLGRPVHNPRRDPLPMIPAPMSRDAARAYVGAVRSRPATRRGRSSGAGLWHCLRRRSGRISVSRPSSSRTLTDRNRTRQAWA